MTRFNQEQLPLTELMDKIQSGSIILTGNKRLSSSLSNQYEKFLIEQGKVVWDTPLIIPLTTWLQIQWESLTLSRTNSTQTQSQKINNLTPLSKLLSANQEAIIWENIINESELTHALLRPEAMAKEVAKAFKIQQQWLLPKGKQEFSFNEDNLAYYYWAISNESLALLGDSAFSSLDNSSSESELSTCNLSTSNLSTPSFDELCQLNNWITPSQLIDEIIQAIRNQSLIIEQSIFLIGFDELNPQQESLLSTIKSSTEKDIQWAEVVYTETGDNSLNKINSRQLAISNQAQEIETMVRWAGHLLHTQPESTIAIVVPDLANLQEQIIYQFNSILLPTNLNPTVTNKHKLWNISLGNPLLNFPIIQSAIKLIRAMSGSLSIDDVKYLLNSSYFIHHEEIHDVALLVSYLINLGSDKVNLSSLHFYAKQTDKSWQCPKLCLQLEGLIQLLDDLPPEKYKGKHRIQSWQIAINQWLKTAMWCQVKSLSSDEFQLLETWNTFIQELNQLDVVNIDVGKIAITEIDKKSDLSSIKSMKTDLNASKAIRLNTLVKMMLGRLSQQVFQSESDDDLPIQILGLYETIGLNFDYCWVLGLHEGVWPPQAKPNVFLPYALQQKFNTPQSSPQRELFIAQKVTQRLINLAPEVIFSYTNNIADQSFNISPLIEHLPQLTIDEISLYECQSWFDDIIDSKQFISIEEINAPALAPGKTHGGSKILSYQSLCPFRAFAEIRLNANSNNPSNIGLDSMQRGNLVHKTMELFWQEVKTQDKLLELNDEELKNQLNSIIINVMNTLLNQSIKTIGNKYKILEQERLLTLLLRWLDEEKKRDSFKVVAFEHRKTVERNGLNFDVIIDRIDEAISDDDKSYKIIIDYKTGDVSPNKWLGDRPQDMQLPLYSTLVDAKELIAVCFAQIKVDTLKYTGIVQSEGLMPNLPSKSSKVLKSITEHWDSTLSHWDSQIDQLITDYISGYAMVDPINGKNTCDSSYCDLSSLCRINELIEN